MGKRSHWSADHRRGLTAAAGKMDFTGRPLKGFIYVEPPGFASDKELAVWVGLVMIFVETLQTK